MAKPRISNGEIILIAPPGVAASLLKPGLFEIQYFTSLDAFEEWRDGKGSRDLKSPLGELVDRTLQEVGIDTAEVPRSLKLAFEWLRCQETVPQLKSFAVAASSRRSFFRRWADVTDLSPSGFLEHLRALYAEELLRDGATLKDVLSRAGCTSLGALRRCLEARHHFPSGGTSFRT
jgi:hypothetical protein